MKIIVVNREATRLRKDRRIRKRIHEEFARDAHVIDHDGRHHALSELAEIADSDRIDTIHVVGGDGTFNDVLNQIVMMPENERPRLVSVGGGQFCYMARFHGFRSSNPIRNLHGIFSDRIKLVEREWQPVRMTDSLSGETRHGALFASGVISDIIEWYESVGKGGLLKVMRVIGGAILSVMSERIRRAHGRIKLLKGELTLGTRIVRPEHYAGFTFANVPELVTSCRPFRGGVPRPYQFSAIAYWGGLKSLAAAAPLLWFGRRAPWINGSMFNAPVHSASVTTTDARIVIDGDLVRLSGGKPGQQRILSFSADETIPLLVVASN